MTGLVWVAGLTGCVAGVLIALVVLGFILTWMEVRDD